MKRLTTASLLLTLALGLPLVGCQERPAGVKPAVEPGVQAPVTEERTQPGANGTVTEPLGTQPDATQGPQPTPLGEPGVNE